MNQADAQTPNHKIKRIVIAGGGTAGWMAAAAIARTMGHVVDLTLVESDAIRTVGVGEATIPPILFFNSMLGIDEAEFMRASRGTYKLGINFEGWRDIGEDYMHGFGFTGEDSWTAGFQHFWKKGVDLGISTDYGDYCLERNAAEANKFAHLPNTGMHYAYHIEATHYAKYLRGLCEKHGITRIEGKITSVQTKPEDGFIQSLTLESGQVVEGDFFIDCTGFKGLLIEKTMQVGYEDWSHWLPCNSAIAAQTKSDNDPLPYTRAIAHGAGWQWKIPLQHRVGEGVVYSDRFMTDDEAKKLMLENSEGEHLDELRVIKFRTGKRLKNWNKNCVALGLASGFLEPLESTSIHMIQQGILRLLKMFPVNGVKQTDIDEYNKQTTYDIEKIRDFIIMHYKVTNRTDTEFWRYCKNMEIPDSLAHRIELFKETGSVFPVDELFLENSWAQVMIGQGIVPNSHHAIADRMTKDELKAFLDNIKSKIQQTVSQLPTHQEYINKFCKTEISN